MPAGVSALVTGMQPVLTAVLGSWLLRETVSPRQWLGFFLGMAGVLLVVGDRIVVEGAQKAAPGRPVRPVALADSAVTQGGSE